MMGDVDKLFRNTLAYRQSGQMVLGNTLGKEIMAGS